MSVARLQFLSVKAFNTVALLPISTIKKRFCVAELCDNFTQFGTAFQLFQLPIHTAFIQCQIFDRT